MQRRGTDGVLPLRRGNARKKAACQGIAAALCKLWFSFGLFDQQPIAIPDQAGGSAPGTTSSASSSYRQKYAASGKRSMEDAVLLWEAPLHGARPPRQSARAEFYKKQRRAGGQRGMKKD